MFKRKKKKTGCETPEFRKPTVPPPKPPTSGSNAVKPRPTVFCIKPEDLNDWVKTVAQIGDVAYCYIREVKERGVYYYLGPDDNPFWRKMDPEFSERHFTKDNKGDDKMNITGVCHYEMPCGWCTKWDKKCDEKIGCEPLILNMSHSASNELLATIQDGVYKTTMISEEQLERKSK